MRIIDSCVITDAVEALCTEANTDLCVDVYNALDMAISNETSDNAGSILAQIKENADIARREYIPICQDTGMAVFFVEIGREVYIEGLNLTDAIDLGVRRGYKNGYLRNSVVGDPIIRTNTGDNTPAVIYYEMVDGDRIKIEFAPKGFGSENKSAVRMLEPSAGTEGIKAFVLETVKKAGADPCPPVIVGVGIGGTMDKAAVLSKKALLKDISGHSDIPHIALLEKELLKEINDLGIGPAGLGGKTTALGVNILTYPTHIAGLPVAVNINCHAARHKSTVI
jgi:fumarate hydratase subunit alpha